MQVYVYADVYTYVCMYIYIILLYKYISIQPCIYIYIKKNVVIIMNLHVLIDIIVYVEKKYR